MKQPLIIAMFLILLSVNISCVSQQNRIKNEACQVEAKKWSKTNGNVKYSEWGTFSATTTDLLPGFKPLENGNFSKYGGDLSNKTDAIGFFKTSKIDNRWWIIDPDGYTCLNIGINGVRPGPSDRNEKALISKFGTNENWILQTQAEILNMGFNGAACWSDVPLLQQSNRINKGSLSYTIISNFFSGYNKQRKKSCVDNISFAVFDPEFEIYCEGLAKTLIETSTDPNLLGHFSDNELTFSEQILDEYLECSNPKDPNQLAALEWLKANNLTKNKITKENREAFLGIVADRYYHVVSDALKKYDPNHMYLGSRLHGRPKHTESIVRAAAKYADIISINYYGQWEPLQKHFDQWMAWADKPILITEFYTKGDDSGMANISGAGWRVKSQEDRGIFYENFCIKLLQMNNCVGWHWFRYMDNDPTDETADPSNNDSNKGIVDNLYQYYQPLINHMQQLNMNRYKLVKYYKR